MSGEVDIMNKMVIAVVSMSGEYSGLKFKDLKSAVEHLTHYGNSDKFSLSSSGSLVTFKDKPRLVFSSYADFVANIEKRILEYMDCDLRLYSVDSWCVSWNIERVEGHFE